MYVVTVTCFTCVAPKKSMLIASLQLQSTRKADILSEILDFHHLYGMLPNES